MWLRWLTQKLNCQFCRDLIIKSEGTFSDIEYFDLLQQGGLIVPTEACIILLHHMYAIFNKLRKDEQKRRIFQFSESPRSILVLLTLEGISRNESFPVDWDDNCLCGTTYNNLFIPLLSVFANVILNNYRKKINDLIVVRKLNASNEKKKREANKENVEENVNFQPKTSKIDNPIVKQEFTKSCKIMNHKSLYCLPNAHFQNFSLNIQRSNNFQSFK